MEESGAVEGAGDVWRTGEPSMCRNVVAVEARMVGLHCWGATVYVSAVELVWA